MADDLLTMKIAIDDRDYLKVQNSQKKFQYSLVEIERAYRKGELTSKQYNRQLVIQSKQLQKLGFSYNQASSQVRQYSFALRNATEQQLNNAQAMSLSGKGMRRFELFAQQAGYQVGDFAVQVQSGTNIAVAFGQQMSQLLGFLGPYGAIAGAGIAIGTGLIAPLLNAKKAAEDTTDAFEDLEQKIASLRDKRLELTTEYNPVLAKAAQRHQSTLDEIVLTQMEIDFNEENYGIALKKSTDSLKSKLYKLKEQYEIESKAYRTLVARLRKEEEALKKAEEAAEWEEGSEKRLQTLTERRFAATMALIELRQKEREEQQKIEDFAAQELKTLQDQNALLQMRKQFGDQSLAVKQLEKDILVENYEAELLRKGVAEDTVKQLAEQYRLSLNLKQELKEMAEITYNFAPVPAVAAAMKKYAGRGTLVNRTPIFGATGKSIYDDPAKPPADVVGDMLKQVRHQKQLLDLTEEERRKEEILFDLKSQDVDMTDDRIDKLIKESEAYYKLNEERDKQIARVDQIGDAFGDMLMNIVDGTMKADDAFKAFMASILKQLYQEIAIDPAVSFLKSFLLADGGVMSRGKLTPFAYGGVVNGPTVFPMANGMGLMGEAGPEAIMPLKRGKDGKLGVEGGSGVTINQNINVSTGVQQTVRTEIKSLMPQIAEASKAAVADAKRRGGSYGRNFA